LCGGEVGAGEEVVGGSARVVEFKPEGVVRGVVWCVGLAWMVKVVIFCCLPGMAAGGRVADSGCAHLEACKCVVGVVVVVLVCFQS
jgi:hypothetical protein